MAILGPRQCGKTTLARDFAYDHYFDLENPADVRRLRNPQTALEAIEGLIVIDEVQRAPEIFPLLRYLIDTHPAQRYLILGSASRELLRQSSESLAGRLSVYELGGFSLPEVDNHWRDLWLRGGLPSSYLASSDEASAGWRRDYVKLFLERDLPGFGISLPPPTLRRLWTMLAHCHGQILNYSELASSFGVSDPTIRRYIDVLADVFMVQTLQPWHANIGKRVVKRPKIYIRDAGILHYLIGIEDGIQLQSHPKLGASWEGFVLDCVFNLSDLPRETFYFWATHSRAELDLFWQRGGKNWGIEIKYQDAPGMTKSIHSALQDLELEHVWIVYPGHKEYPVHERVTVIPVTELRKCPI